MRVIAGELKGRQLKAVPGKTTRPTADKVKEAVFQAIGPFFDGGKVMDLFAGSGSLGIEALSRGMDKCVFVDKHTKAIHTIHENVKAMKLEDQVEVFRADAFRAMNKAAERRLRFDLILLDPPYKKVDYEKLLNEIFKLQLIRQNGIVYCEHDISEKLPDNHGNFTLMKHQNYGGTVAVSIYKLK